MIHTWLQPSSAATGGAQEAGAQVLMGQAAQQLIQVIFSLRSSQHPSSMLFPVP